MSDFVDSACGCGFSEFFSHVRISEILTKICLNFFYKGRCTRDNCKYLHPPPHLKSQLEINGRNNLIQQRTVAAMFAQQMQLMLQNAQMSSLVSCGRVFANCQYMWGFLVAV